ncbi:PfkB family carbohydrate kinase [Kribbella sp. NPDC051936]|uniref:PfkB family carbohydrate kinase n=1 Tax=Kribbella sp. NPDC051936 TaxID=3154946 RepID=UPI00343AE28D
MIETAWSVTGERVVIDPQHGDLEPMLDSTSATSLAVVLNANEAERQTGLGCIEAGHQIRGRGIDVVVIKRGALGGLVFSDAGVEAYGAIPTDRVRPIGSGDAFTAGFTHAWALDPSAPTEAARFGAQVAAAHSLIGIPQVSPELLATLASPLTPIGETPRVYVAAPFFTLPERLLLEVVRGGLSDSGIAVFSPFHDVGLGGDEVALADLDGLQACHAVLALLDGADPGTVFEVGWATKASIPVIGFCGHPPAHEWTMLRGTGSTVTDDLPTAVYQAGWAAIGEVYRREQS